MRILRATTCNFILRDDNNRHPVYCGKPRCEEAGQRSLCFEHWQALESERALKQQNRRSRTPAFTPAPATSDRKPDVSGAITPIEYGGLQAAFDFFNATLFAKTMPDCFIVYQRKANSAGYFAADRYAGRIGQFGKHELALNPDGFIGQSDEQICQTLVHEMCHAWQQQCGKPSKRGYHNREWADKMKSIGLQPSSTGMVGGNEVGQRMSDYVIPDGRFVLAFAELARTGWKLNLQSAPRAGGTKAPVSKVKSTCPKCGGNAWAKPDYVLACVACGNVAMVPETQAYVDAA
jgi:predicted SprT family Zn-dependent metalloprotease